MRSRVGLAALKHTNAVLCRSRARVALGAAPAVPDTEPQFCQRRACLQFGCGKVRVDSSRHAPADQSSRQAHRLHSVRRPRRRPRRQIGRLPVETSPVTPNVNSLDANTTELIDGVAAANRKTIINVDPATLMPWLPRVGAVLKTWYPGGEGGTATARLLLGAGRSLGASDQRLAGELRRHDLRRRQSALQTTWRAHDLLTPGFGSGLNVPLQVVAQTSRADDGAALRPTGLGGSRAITATPARPGRFGGGR